MRASIPRCLRRLVGDGLVSWRKRKRERWGAGNLRPRIFGCGNIALSVKGNMDKGITVDKLHRPVNDADDTAQDAEHDRSDNVSLAGFLLLRDAHCLPYQINQSHDQGPKANASKAVRHAPAERAPRRSPWHSAWLSRAKVPASVQSRNGAVQRILDPFADPVSCKCDEDQQADDLCTRAASGARTTRTCWIAHSRPAVTRFVLDIHCDQRDRVPRTKGKGRKAANGACHKDVPVPARNIHRRLQHHNTKRYARNPTNKTDHAKDGK